MQGKRYFAAAKVAAGLQVEMTAAMGVRTKHQRNECAQLYLYAKSSLLPLKAPREAKTANLTLSLATIREDQAEEGKEDSSEGGWKHAQWELGRRLVKEAEGGEEVAVR